MALASPAAAKAPLLSCPLAGAPFSVDGPLVDVLLSPRASALLRAAFPGKVEGLPPLMATTKAPTFGAIMSIRGMAKWMGWPTASLAALDADLRQLPVTGADRIARCARYDDDRPVFRLPPRKPAILLFAKITGFRDGPSVEAGQRAVERLARENGWAVVVTDKGGVMRPEILRRFRVVVWNNVSGDVLTLPQRAAFRRYVEQGGGYVGIHGSAGDPLAFWDWYLDRLVGARFLGHPRDPQFQRATIRMERSPLGAKVPAEWSLTDEWYSFTANPRQSGAHVVATLDERSYAPGPEFTMGDHPIAWTRDVGRGRSFYSAIGHRPEVYDDARVLELMRAGIAWAGKLGPNLKER
ncbi:ThuA domain-containing protein [Novosphingobium flavum]|nr:ThuA domain-containing protein [Novosphingobium flavum]